MGVATGRFAIAGALLALAGLSADVGSDRSRAFAAEAPPPSGAIRILSLGGDVTEILYALGQGDKVVAVDTTSQFPASALKEKKSVGYLRALSAEGVLAVNPTLIIASEQAGPPEVVKAVKSSGVQYADIAEKQTAEGVPDKVRRIGGIVGAEAEAEKLATKVAADFAALDIDRKQIKEHKKVLFILAIQNGRATVGGTGTGADAILQLAGADNAAASVTGYKPVSDEQLAELAPDAVVVMRRGDGDRHSGDLALSLPGLSQTPAAKNKGLIEMDGQYLLGFGPRAPAAAHDLMKALYSGPGQTAATP
ncbi:hemin ABC transporter substrate-binding protein [Hyphomicrobium sp. 99]|uniref:heme/hemin ABC transporter substrate-binding protein n=1 Tax=Hyphomicrobium sp. 99 TaxID=1163419 RepID=UPI0005F7E9ED|nr:ABC transporter substrate-binding protein [Hyphomicrobium sp. 99]